MELKSEEREICFHCSPLSLSIKMKTDYMVSIIGLEYIFEVTDDTFTRVVTFPPLLLLYV